MWKQVFNLFESKTKLKERNPKSINDDYVKFIRYGQYLIDNNNEGIICFINPHGFHDNPTFRGMRWNLLKCFDKIYTIDLHGNSRKKEVKNGKRSADRPRKKLAFVWSDAAFFKQFKAVQLAASIPGQQGL